MKVSKNTLSYLRSLRCGLNIEKKYWPNGLSNISNKKGLVTNHNFPFKIQLGSSIYKCHNFIFNFILFRFYSNIGIYNINIVNVFYQNSYQLYLHYSLVFLTRLMITFMTLLDCWENYFCIINRQYHLFPSHDYAGDITSPL